MSLRHDIQTPPTYETSPQATVPHVLESSVVLDFTVLDVVADPIFANSLETAGDPFSPYRVDQKPEVLIGELYSYVLAEKERLASDSDIVAVRMDKGSYFAHVARFVEATEFKDAWYQAMDPITFAKKMYEEYDPYDADSRFVVLMDTAPEAIGEDDLPTLIGMARVAGGDETLLKTVHDMPAIWSRSQEEILDDLKICLTDACEGIDVGNPATTEDYSSLAVNKAYRNTDAYSLISHELYKWSMERGVNTITTIFVEKFFRLYQLRGVPFRAICDVEPKVHMEELSRPVVMHLPESERMQHADNPRVRGAYAQMVQGVGFDYCQVTA